MDSKASNSLACARYVNWCTLQRLRGLCHVVCWLNAEVRFKLSCFLRAVRISRDTHVERSIDFFSQPYIRLLLIHINQNQQRGRRSHGMARQRLVYFTVECFTITHFEQKAQYRQMREDTKSYKFNTPATSFDHIFVSLET